MKKKILQKIVQKLSGALLCAAAVGSQAAVLSVDMVPGAAIDASRVVAPTDGFDVDVVVEDVLDLAGFQFDLSFDPALVSATLPVAGAGLFAGFALELSNSLLGSVITFSEVSTDVAGIDVVGATRLGSIHFTSLAAGTSAFALSNVVLSDSFGDSLATQTGDGALTSRAPPIGAAAPETLSLAMLGLLAMAVARKRRR